MTHDLSPVETVVLQGASVDDRHAPIEPELARTLFRDIFENAWAAPKLTVVWRSDAPMLMTPDDHERSISEILTERDQQAADAVEIAFCIHAKSIALTEAWISFLKAHRQHLRLVLTCDGPGPLNPFDDAVRIRTKKTMWMLSKLDIPFKVIAAVSDHSLDDPDAFYDDFSQWAGDIDGFHMQMPRQAPLVSDPWSTQTRSDRDRHYDFYRHLLHRARLDSELKKPFRIQNFAQALARIVATSGDPVADASRPLRSLTMDAQGFVTAFHAGLSRTSFAPLYDDVLGLALSNIHTMSLRQMVETPKFRTLCADLKRCQRVCRRNCDYYGICPGGFELRQLAEGGVHGGGETAECLVKVKALTDAVLDDISDNARAQLRVVS